MLATLVLALGTCGLLVYRVAQSPARDKAPEAPLSSPAPAPDYVLKVLSLECQTAGGIDRGELTVLNVGSATIPNAKVFVEFHDKAGKTLSATDSYLRPSTIPPGSRASARVWSSSKGAATCAPTAFQDGQGAPVRIQF